MKKTVIEMKFEKGGEGSIIVIREATVAESRTEYTIRDLKKQRLEILESLNSFVASRKSEITEIDTMLAEAEKLGIKEKIDVDTTAARAKVEDVL
jgi:hypothetical protein